MNSQPAGASHRACVQAEKTGDTQVRFYPDVKYAAAFLVGTGLNRLAQFCFVLILTLSYDSNNCELQTISAILNGTNHTKEIHNIHLGIKIEFHPAICTPQRLYARFGSVLSVSFRNNMPS